jgi:hypothetical protein
LITNNQGMARSVRANFRRMGPAAQIDAPGAAFGRGRSLGTELSQSRRTVEPVNRNGNHDVATTLDHRVRIDGGYRVGRARVH